jgi:hypothetical protein
MISLYLQQFLRWCRFGFILIGLIGLSRLIYVAYYQQTKAVTYTPVPTETMHRPSNHVAQKPESIQQALVEKLKMNPAPLPSELLALELVPTTGTASTAPKTTPVTRVYLAVHQGPARSEVRLNGVTLGQTPYVGEITCKRGEPLEFVLIPPKGMPRRSNHICDRTEITIADRPRNQDAD